MRTSGASVNRYEPHPPHTSPTPLPRFVLPAPRQTTPTHVRQPRRCTKHDGRRQRGSESKKHDSECAAVTAYRRLKRISAGRTNNHSTATKSRLTETQETLIH